MKQHVAINNDVHEAKRHMDEVQKEGWFVHTMATTKRTGTGTAFGLCVVYRKDK